MPSLIVETSGVRRGGVITSRVLIGRLPTNGVVLAETSVSRLHAWIDCDLDGVYYVADTGSLTGTWVNSKAVERRHELKDGDVIRVGKALLTYHETSDIPPDVQPSNLAGFPPFEDVDQAGVLFECACGAPAWFKATAIGQTHKCRQCGRGVVIPDKPGVRAHPIGEPVGVEASGGHALAEAAVGHSAAAASHLPPDEHGLSESFAGQTAVAEAEPQSDHAREHGLLELQTSPGIDEAGSPAPFHPDADTKAAEEGTAGGHTSAFEAMAGSPTLEQMLEAEVPEPPLAVENTADPIFTGSQAVDSFAEPHTDAPPHIGEPAPVEVAAASVAGELASSAGETAPAEEIPADIIAAIHDEASARHSTGESSAEAIEPTHTELSPPAEGFTSFAEATGEVVPAAERPSLFSSRRRPLAEPQPVAVAESAPPAETAATTHDRAIGRVQGSPSLDAFDAYTDENAGGAAVDDGPAAPGDHAATPSESTFAAQDQEAERAETCSVCHTAIGADEATTTCPSCGLTFHAECWHENQGCSAYGCPQVGVLAPREQPQSAAAGPAVAAGYDGTEPEEGFPWEYLYLAASIVGTLLGLLVFGVPALIAALGTVIYKIRFPDPARRNGVVTLSILLALVGVGLGFVASVYWWFGGFAGVDWGRLRPK